MHLIDTHCHLDRETRFGDLDTLFTNCAAHNVRKLVCVGFDMRSSEEGLKISEERAGESPEVWAAVGFHPHDASQAGAAELKKMETLLKHPRCVALGEIGLDFFYDNSPRDVQREVFCAQIELACSAKKPIVTHIRDAKERPAGDANTESIQMLASCGADRVGGVIHCFSGNMKDAEAALALGFYISFAGPITYPKNDELRRIAANVPLDRILCETDAPYLAPQQFRGKKNEPANVRFVYELIARECGMALDEFVSAVAENAERLFGWSAANV
ncbi:TatD family hydrolase [Synergistaceae bacterium OttesenSCG-928-D05]|nr:TatD family hydrolase [Synergistaceae bacterium OttesenSCG-928-D05]